MNFIFFNLEIVHLKVSEHPFPHTIQNTIFIKNNNFLHCQSEEGQER